MKNQFLKEEIASLGICYTYAKTAISGYIGI